MKDSIVLTGGGSAGHVTPNLALVPYLEEKGYSLHYIGTASGIEHELIKDLPYHIIEAGKLRRYASKENIKDFFRIFKGYRQAKAILREIMPKLVFSKGGFVSVPVVWAASKLKIPVVIHESDYSPGLANRLCVKKAKKVCLSFDSELSQDDKYVFTGSPVRKELLGGDRSRGLDMLGFSGKKPVLLIMGGSLGAKAVNDVVDSSIGELTKRYSIVHMRGKGNLNKALDAFSGYRQYEFMSDGLPDIFAAADIALSRAGANAIFEYLALRIPPLLVPLPLSASRGDQIQNAEYFKKHGYAMVLEQESMNNDTLLSLLEELYSKKDTFVQNMLAGPGANGTENVLKVIYESIGN